jgi:hypothetical protein
VGNAIKFTDAGEVAIKVEANNGSFRVSVRDTGPGISAADQAKLFQEFQQADNAITRKKGGTGLGLAISKLCRDARRQYLGRVAGRPRLDICFHASGHRRAAGGSVISEPFLPSIAAVHESAFGTKRTFAAVQCNVRFWG